ncbi:uncharacterized protein LOC128740929 [Sabethes cyaneus]|uniref:uncharacterized protein LOC128740929 n=1 Tax=Sabethes cyaneus TaxID=53552 RepID=UPI00237EC1B8|nr:uncharacterized protein LOC128740929 [Sabethes cyaneus]
MADFNWFGRGTLCLIFSLALGLGKVAVTQGWEGFPVQHSITKRMDLETCLVHFDVHLNTIIRTEESRSMGAKFLDDADVNSREQCLRLCCETQNCDVFVFEEKNQGTCFLFQCGPPTDFHCKFTRHSNYTSAVLKIPSVEQPPPPLVNQIHSLTAQPAPVAKLSQHELELVNLKAPKPQVKSDGTTLIPPLGIQLGQQPTTTTTTTTTPSQCGHYEFPCHSGECIAVYNACDGIPQCADGSDEGPECRRPPPIKSFQPISVQQQQPQQQQQQQQQLQPALNSMLLPNAPMFPSDFQQQPDRRAQQEQQKMAHQMPHNREDPMTAPKPWPRPLADPQNGYLDAPDSRIFNHKSGLQLASNQMTSSQYQDSLPDTSYVPNIPRNGPYLPLQNNYQSSAQQWTDPRLSAPQRTLWPNQPQLPQEQYVQPPPQHQPDAVQPPPMQAPAQIIPSQQQQQQQQIQTAPEVDPNLTGADLTKQPKLDTAPPSPKKPSEPHGKSTKSSEEYESYDEQYQESKSSSEQAENDEKQEPPPQQQQQKKKQHKHHNKQHGEEHKKKNKSGKSSKKDKAIADEHPPAPVHEHLKMLRNDLEIEFTDHDRLAERPGGAVLSLTLGAILTAALAIMIGCRMKVARRRIRRQGKSSYAHDADFLVNGMYL